MLYFRFLSEFIVIYVKESIVFYMRIFIYNLLSVMKVYESYKNDVNKIGFCEFLYFLLIVK